jgi:hypothetical protein
MKNNGVVEKSRKRYLFLKNKKRANKVSDMKNIIIIQADGDV